MPFLEESEMNLGCDETVHKYSLKEGCCDSCHEEANEYGVPFEEWELTDGTIVEVCCRVVHELAAAGLYKEK